MIIFRDVYASGNYAKKIGKFCWPAFVTDIPLKYVNYYIGKLS